MMENRKVCIIIVSYNFEPWIDKCLLSVFASTLPATVMVIDNNSSDNTVGKIKQDYPQVILIENNVFLGFGKGKKVGLC